MTRLFALVDCNNFYCSVLRVFMPWLIGKPILVLSNNDGCVIARSNEVKELGIAMVALFFEIQDLIKLHNIACFSSNYELFGSMSFRVVETLRKFTPNIEVYSIDECFIDLGGFKFLDLHAYARNIKDTVYQNTGIPVCVGVAPTKTLAKIANRLAKKSKKAAGSLVLTEPAHIEEALKRTEIGDVWGIGRQYAEMFREAGIHNAFELTQADDAWIQKVGTIVMLRTVKELRGEACADLEIIPDKKKEICTSRGFGKPVVSFQALLEATTTYAAKCAYKLRKQQTYANEIEVLIQTSRFAKAPRYNNKITIKLPEATNCDMELIKYVKIALESIYLPGYKYKKSGVVVKGLIPAGNRQLNLITTTNHSKQETLMQFIDGLTAIFGRDTVKLACQGTKKKQEWAMNRELLSPSFTTRWSDILVIHI